MMTVSLKSQEERNLTLENYRNLKNKSISKENREMPKVDPMVMRNGSPDWDLVERLIKEYRPTTIILGKPKVIDESSETLMKKIKAFKRSLEKDFSQNVEWTPEHLTSKDAKEKLKVRRQEGILSRKIMKGQIDSMAAAIFLQDWMNQR